MMEKTIDLNLNSIVDEADRFPGADPDYVRNLPGYRIDH